jgi:tRNA threonylcarbamoyladenosine biosynthesis protein TsaB
LTALVALETSTRRGSVALLADDVVTEAVLAGERAHASDLLPELDRLLGERGLRLDALDAVVVGLGPGSYTGLRVACATALGLARGAGLALVGVPSFEAAAFVALEPGEEGVVLQDARSGAVYHAWYRRNDGVVVVSPPAVARPEDVAARLGAPLPLIGDEAALLALGLDAAARERLRPALPTAAVLARLGRARLAAHGPSAPEAIEPLYLRPFAARRAPYRER